MIQTRDPIEVRPSERTSWLSSAGGLGLFALASAAVAVIGGLITARRPNRIWYRLLRKSPATPPDRTFSIVWPVLYGLGAWSAWRVARSPSSPRRTAALALWATQLATNGLWTPAFFGAHRPRLAGALLAGNVASLGAYAWLARGLDPSAAAAVAPNLAWLGFASVLNFGVIARNSSGPTRLLAHG